MKREPFGRDQYGVIGSQERSDALIVACQTPRPEWDAARLALLLGYLESLPADALEG